MALLPLGRVSTTTRLVLLIFASLGLALAAALAFVVFASQHALLRAHEDLVTEMRDELVAQDEAVGIAGMAQAISERIAANPDDDAYVVLVDPRGQAVVGNIASFPVRLPRLDEWLEIDVTDNSGTAHRAGFVATPLPGGYLLLTGHVLSGNELLSSALRQSILTTALLLVPFSLVIALIIGRIIDRRIERLARGVRLAGQGDLSRRVEMPAGDDAFDRLARTINAMLERIEAAVTEMRTITDGLAHDLRSPLSRMKSRIERATAQIGEDGSGDAHLAETFEGIRIEADALLAMLTTALQISRAEAGIGRERFADTSLRQVLDEIAELYVPLAEDAGFALCVAPFADFSLPLHRELIGQALGNLIENAIKHAAGGSAIRLAAAPCPGGAIISVADDGPGIAPEFREQALRRFSRLDPARGESGAGLGLSLVEATARLHGGSVELADNAPGLVVRLILAPLQ